MKYPSITNYIETLLNPTGRFKTLKSVVPLLDSDGTPMYTIKDDVVDFYVKFGGENYFMKCRLRANPLLTTPIDVMSRYINDLNHPNLTSYKFYESEVLVFDDAGESNYYGLILMSIPDGKRLDLDIQDMCDTSNKQGLTKIFKAVSQLALNIIDKRDFVHTNIKPSNLIFTNQSELKLLNYKYMKIPLMDCWDIVRNDDNIALANMLLVLYVLSYNPVLYDTFGTNSAFTLSHIRLSLIDVILSVDSNRQNEPLMALVSLIRDCDHRIDDNEKLKEVIVSLQDCTLGVSVDTTHDAVKSGKAIRHSHGINKSAFDSMGDLHESRIAIELNGKFGYISDEGDEVVPAKYDWVDDFKEGLAIVQSNYKYGVIDKDGKEILAIEYTDISWVPENGVILVSKDDKWGVFDRCGTPKGVADFDHIDDFSCDLAPVRRGRKWGYINRDCKAVIPIIYDAALPFNMNGLGEVIYNKRRIYFEPTGAVYVDDHKVTPALLSKARQQY